MTRKKFKFMEPTTSFFRAVMSYGTSFTQIPFGIDLNVSLMNFSRAVLDTFNDFGIDGTKIL